MRLGDVINIDNVFPVQVRKVCAFGAGLLLGAYGQKLNPSNDGFTDVTVTNSRGQERPEAVRSLAQSGLSIKGIASATGADRNTVRKDLRQGGEIHPPAERHAQRLMQVGGNAALANPTHVSDIPASLRALMELSRLPPEAIESGIESGDVHPGMTARDAKGYAAEVADRAAPANVNTDTGEWFSWESFA